MIPYPLDYLNNTTIFTTDELESLYGMNQIISLSKFLGNSSYVDKFGMDFIYTSAQLEGNTYTMNDVLTLLEYGYRARDKPYCDATMIVNMKEAYNLLIHNNINVTKGTLIEIHRRLFTTDALHSISQKHLEEGLEILLSTYASIDNPFDRALYLHCNLAWLHYFKKGNRCTARMMLNVSLKYDGMMIYIPYEQRTVEYLSAITAYCNTGTYEQFKQYFIHEYAKTAEMISFVEHAKRQEQHGAYRRHTVP